jgi:hypothetical protein
LLAASRLAAVPPPLPLPFIDAFLGLMAVRALMAATSLGVCAALAERPDRRRRPGAQHRVGGGPLGVLLSALAALGYVRRRGGRYRLTRTARRWLAPGARQGLDALVGPLSYLGLARHGRAPGGSAAARRSARTSGRPTTRSGPTIRRRW